MRRASLAASTALAGGVVAGMLTFVPSPAAALDFTWSGAASSVFAAAGNWTEPGATPGPPGAADNALIPANGANAPVVGTTTTVNNVGVGVANLTVSNTITLNSTLLILNAGGTLTGPGTFSTGTFQMLGGTVAANATVTASTGFDIQAGNVAGTLSGAAQVVKTTGAAVTFGGANNYTGGTSVTAGSLTLTGAGTLGAAANTLAVGNATLDLGGTTQNQASATLTGGTIQNGTLALTGTFQMVGGNVLAGTTVNSATGFDLQGGSVAGVLGGAAAVNTSGAVVLSGVNLYSGGTAVNSGTLNINSNAALGAAAGALAVNNAVLQFAAGFTIPGARAVTLGAGTGVIDTNGNNVTINSVIGGPGSLVKNGDGTLTLGGANTYAGGTVLNRGTVSIATDGNLGNAAGGVSFGSIAGSDGTLSITANIATARNFGITANGTVNTNGNTLTASGDFSGNFALAKNGAGTLVLSGNNGGFGGGILLNQGTLSLANTSAASFGSLFLNGSVVVDLSGGVSMSANQFLAASGGQYQVAAGTATITGAFSETTPGSSYEKIGAGTLVLTGGNTATGTFTISDGTVQIGNGGGTGALDTGNVVDNAALVFNRTGTLTYNGNISGTGTLTQNSPGGIAVLGGANSYLGATTVAAGELRINGSLTNSAVTVQNGGTLSGIGTIAGAVTVQSGGTLSAGQSPGTLTVGTLNLNAGSISTFELGNPGVVGGAANDLVVVTGAGAGALTLGGTLNAGVASAGFYRLYSLTGGGTIAGNYATVNVTPTGPIAGTITSTIYTNSPGLASQVNLSVLGAGQVLQFWDGTDTTGVSTGPGTGTVDGGNGVWNATSTNWTGAPGQADVNAAWQSSVGVFQGTAGVVAVAGAQSFDTLQFNVTGYNLTGGQLQFSTGTGVINTNGAGVAATIGSQIIGPGSLVKVGAGALILTAANTYAGGTTVAGGTLQVAGGSLASGVTVDPGAFLVNSATINGGVINNGTATSTGVINGGVANAGTFSAENTISGPIANNAGTFTVTGVLAGDNTFTNGGAAELNVAGGNFTGITTLTNSSSSANGILVAAGRTLSAGTIVNGAGSTIRSQGTLAATTLITNAGFLNAQGTLNTPQIENNGTFTLTGNLTGAITTFNNNGGARLDIGALSFTGVNTLTTAGTTAIGSGSLAVAASIANSGTFTSAGTVTTPVFNNTGFVNASGTFNTANLSNAGAVTVTGPLAVNGAFSNPGTVAFASGATLTVGGALANTGALDMRNGATNNVVTVGSYSGGGTLGVDFNVGNLTADRLVVAGGAASGATTVNFAQVGGFGASSDLLVISGASGASFLSSVSLPTTNASPFPAGGQLISAPGGILQYWFGETTPGSGTFVIRPDLNAAAAASFIASVSSAVSAINAFNEPASAFIGGPADPEPNKISIGTWGRGRGGNFDISAGSIVGSPTGLSRSFQNKSDSRFNGFQLGIDLGIYNIQDTGWSFNIGLHGGKVESTSKSPQTLLDMSQPFFGAYAALRNGSGFALDVLVRKDQLDMKITSAEAGLFNQKLKGDGWSGLASVTQRFNITDSIYIDPSVAVLYSRSEIDPLTAGVGTVLWQPIESITGRAGVQIGTYIQPNPDVIVAPYAAFSVWREFAGSTKASGTLSGQVFPVSTDRLGTYGQASLGVAVSSPKPGFSAFVRGDVRFGAKIDGYALNGGVRYQF